MFGSEGSCASGKSGAVTSLYANVFSYINTQFVRGINILEIDYSDYSLIIHPFFETRLEGNPHPSADGANSTNKCSDRPFCSHLFSVSA